MTGDGGLIALSLDDADRILDWGRLLFNEDMDMPEDGELFERIREWRARHSEATP